MRSVGIEARVPAVENPRRMRIAGVAVNVAQTACGLLGWLSRGSVRQLAPRRGSASHRRDAHDRDNAVSGRSGAPDAGRASACPEPCPEIRGSRRSQRISAHANSPSRAKINCRGLPAKPLPAAALGSGIDRSNPRAPSLTIRNDVERRRLGTSRQVALGPSWYPSDFHRMETPAKCFHPLHLRGAGISAVRQGLPPASTPGQEMGRGGFEPPSVGL